jgi:glycosyltransferase involved in cell wall biosynthesis
MIVINVRFLSQKITGVQRYALEICKRLPKEIGGEKVLFVSPKVRGSKNFNAELNIMQIGRFSGQLWEQLDLPIFLKKNKNPLLVNLVGIAPIYYRNKIMAIYDLAFKHYPEWFSFKFQKSYNLLIPISLKNTKTIVTDSYYVKEDIHKTYKIEKSDIHVIYAAPSKKFHQLDLERDNFFLTVSSIDPRKNLKRIIEAFNLLKSNYKLVIVGSKNKTFSGLKFEENLLNERIVFTGYLEDDELIELYNRAEIFIYASLFEGFGIPPLEAQACDCPCLVSNTTSLPEVYADSVEYCDPYSVESIKEKMNFLLNDQTRRIQLKKMGQLNVKRFDWDISSKKFENIIAENIL